MNSFKMIAIFALLLAAGSAFAQSMGTSAGYDLDSLWAAAQKAYDLDGEDAVVLLESQKVSIGDDGAVSTRVHRVVWINSSVGIHTYADLRVPWNSETSALEVEILRTWMDRRWWPDASLVSGTAVVHTLPYALDRADDYTAMRETMLLHDGVELPCILETAYTITERGLPAADGLFVFPQQDPAVRVELTVETPAASPWHAEAVSGAPAGTQDLAGGRRTIAWTMSPVPALRQPVTAQPEAYEPAVVWSTWENWQVLADSFSRPFDTAAFIEGALADSLRARTLHLTDPVSFTKAILDFAGEAVRDVHYDHYWWQFAPRSAQRTWETGYGHALDRAVLAAGALRAFAILPNDDGRRQVAPTPEIVPLLAGEGMTLLAPEVPRLARAGQIVLAITIPEVGGFVWVPAEGLLAGAWYLGRHLTRLDDLAAVYTGSQPGPNRLDVSLVLGAVSEETRPLTGVLSGAGVFNLQGGILVGNESLDKAANAVVTPLLDGLGVESVRPHIFNQHHVRLQIEGEMVVAEADGAGRTTLLVGDPGDGLLSHLPHDVHLYEANRRSPVLIDPLEQAVRIQVDLAGVEPAHLPATRDIVNEAGRFLVDCTVADGWLSYRRTLSVTGKGTWPELRILLLEEADPLNGTIILKEMESE